LFRALKKLCALACVLPGIGISLPTGAATISAYPLPSIYTTSTVYSLKADGVSIPVVNYVGEYDYAEFSMTGGAATIEVTATTQTGIGSYRLSPAKHGLTATKNVNKLTFTLPSDRYLIVQINGLKKLILAADPGETSAPPASGAGIFNVTAAPYNADPSGATKSTTACSPKPNPEFSPASRTSAAWRISGFAIGSPAERFIPAVSRRRRRSGIV
jgi:hypothetical protein